MRDDEKMFNLGLFTMLTVVGLIVFLQVCYRVQNENLAAVRNSLDNTRHEYSLAETRFSKLSSGDYLRSSVTGMNPTAATVSFSKTVHIDSIKMEE